MSRLIQAVFSSALLFGAAPTWAAGLMTPVDGSTPALDLVEHHVEVTVEDGYASTRVEQVFHNPHDRDLEAIYSFPVPEHASVGEFVVWIDGQPVVGEVLPKDQAREVYRQEQNAGRDAGLAEQDTYKTFDLRVSPVRAGQDTRVRLRYYQAAAVDSGVGRYVYPLEEGGVDEERLAFWTAQPVVRDAFSFRLNLRSSYPVEALRLPDYPQAQVVQQGPGEWSVVIERDTAASEEAGDGTSAAGAFSLDKDLVVYWRHQSGLPGSVDWVGYRPDGAERGTFMLTFTPGEDLKPITEGQDWVFVLDVSGSMSGKYATLAEGIERALGKMRPHDRFRIVLFNDRAREITRGFVAATPANIQSLLSSVRGLGVGGGTNLYAGLESGLRGLDADRTSSVVLITDGVANVGKTLERDFLKLVENQDVRLFTFVMGNSANLPLLEHLAAASNGFAMTVSNSDDIVGKILLASSKVTHEALNDVQVKIHGVKTTDLTPALIGSLYRGQQLVVMGHYWGGGEAEVELTGRRSGVGVRYHTRFDVPEHATRNPELERLWAYARIRDLEMQQALLGADGDRAQAMTDLALEYGLVTDRTSMIVLQEEQFAEYGIDRRNRDRVEREAAARIARQAQPVQATRADTAQPMYANSRPDLGGGGGSFGGWSLAALGALLVYRRLQRS